MNVSLFFFVLFLFLFSYQLKDKAKHALSLTKEAMDKTAQSIASSEPWKRFTQDVRNAK
jgi:hypothetical protein